MSGAGYSGHEIYQRMVVNAAGTQQIETASEAAKILAEGYRELNDALLGEQQKLTTFWRGASAEAAAGGLQPLLDANIEYMANLDMAEKSFNGMAMFFNGTRAALRPVSANRPQASIDVGAPSGRHAALQWDEDNRHNIQQYHSYGESQDLNLKHFPREYKPFEVKLSGGSVETTRPDASVGSADIGGYTGGGYAGGGFDARGVPRPSDGNYSAGTVSAPPSFDSTPAAPPPSAPPPSPAPAPSAPAVQQSPVTQQPPAMAQPPAADWYWSADDSGTSTAGYASPPPAGYGPSSGYGPAAGAGGYSGGYGAGRASSGSYGGYGGYYTGGYSSGGYPGGGFGPRGNPDAPASGGRTTGTAPYGSSGSAASRAYTASTGSGSSSSSYGRAMMGGAGAGQGQGGEDEEHERKFTVTPDDPDTLFGGIPEGTVVAPPVIGE